MPSLGGSEIGYQNRPPRKSPGRDGLQEGDAFLEEEDEDEGDEDDRSDSAQEDELLDDEFLGRPQLHGASHLRRIPELKSSLDGDEVDLPDDLLAFRREDEIDEILDDALGLPVGVEEKGPGDRIGLGLDVGAGSAR